MLLLLLIKRRMQLTLLTNVAVIEGDLGRGIVRLSIVTHLDF